VKTHPPARQEAWPRCPEASEYFSTLFRAFAAHNPAIAALSDRLLTNAGVPLKNLVDHWSVPPTHSLWMELDEIGLRRVATADGDAAWEHPAARLPRVRIEDGSPVRMAIAVDDLQLFADCQALPSRGQHGDPDSGYEEIRYPQDSGELAVLVRRGYLGFRAGHCSPGEVRALNGVRQALRARDRSSDPAEIEERLPARLAAMADDVGRDRLVDEFFAAERDYYMRSNSAARWQYGRQQEMGIGWANHDHHTYRSSRSAFRALIRLWLQLGFEPREKFYAGAEAGWGAQILEHPVSRVVLFCDVDMAPHEIGIEFADEALPDLPSVGTIGLWCGLHGESIGQAGLHHLEAEFDFARVREQLKAAGHGVMPPFTDLPMLKQAFTEPETWSVPVERASAQYERGLITAEQRNHFIERGAPGSHLEILQRWEGFKGFNKTGIDAIIRETDARNAKT